MEHNGLMSDEEYSKSFLFKLKQYTQAGYRLGQNLLLTFEYEDYPLDLNNIEQYLREAFLPK